MTLLVSLHSLTGSSQERRQLLTCKSVCEREQSIGGSDLPPSLWVPPAFCRSPSSPCSPGCQCCGGRNFSVHPLLGCNISKSTVSSNPKPEKNSPCRLEIKMTFLSRIVTVTQFWIYAGYKAIIYDCFFLLWVLWLSHLPFFPATVIYPSNILVTAWYFYRRKSTETEHWMPYQRPLDKLICSLRMESSDSLTQMSFRVCIAFHFKSWGRSEERLLNIGKDFSAM